MAKSYLGYVEKDQQAFVDWGAIGSQISQDLDKIRVNRQEQRDELDRVTNEAVTTINELTANQPKLVSEFYMDGANDMRQYLLMLNKEMKSGRLNPAEYMKKKQVLMDGVTQLGDASKAFAEDYENAMKRLQNGEAAAQEIFQNEMYDAFRTTEDKGIYVNPADGRVYIAKRNIDGTINRNQSDLLSVNKLYARRKDQINKFDVVGETSKKVNVLGDVVKAMRRGNVMTLKDVMQNPQYKKAEGDIINSMMASPRNAASVLSDYVGGYQFTQDPSIAAGDPNMILLKEDGMGLLMPELNAEQRKTAEEALRAQIRVQLDKVETPMPVFAPQSGSGFGGFGVEREKDLGHLEILRKIYAGNEAEVNTALQNIPQINREIKRVRKQGNKLIIEYNPVLDKDGEVTSQRSPQTLDIAQGGLELFATQAGRALIPGLNVEPAWIDWQRSPYSGRSQKYSETGGESGGLFNVSPAIISMDDVKAAEQLRPMLPDGFSVRTYYNPLDNGLVITAPNGKTIDIETKETNADVITGELAKLTKFVQENSGVSLPADAGSINTSQYNSSNT
jgi:hypothetical protein